MDNFQYGIGILSAMTQNPVSLAGPFSERTALCAPVATRP